MLFSVVFGGSQIFLLAVTFIVSHMLYFVKHLFKNLGKVIEKCGTMCYNILQLKFYWPLCFGGKK